MSVLVAKEELGSFTVFQREMHTLQNPDEGIISDFYRVLHKSTWYSSLNLKLQSSRDSEEMVYCANPSFHYLMYSYMRFELPSISVKPEFKGKVRIAWPHNIGTNVIVNASFKEDDDTYQTWDNHWADIYFQFFQKKGAGKRDVHNQGIGNVECLEAWSEHLPRYPINVGQPWFYSADSCLSWALFYKNTQVRAEHRYIFKLKIAELLRMQVLTKDRRWEDRTKGHQRYLNIGPTDTIKTPELWARYAYVTDKELEYHKCAVSRTFYIRDIEKCDASNPNKYNSTATIDLHSKTPCLAIFWVAENREATLNHNFSNYTTDSHDVYSGWDPIQHTSLKYGTTVKLDQMPSDHFSIAQARDGHFPSAPSERGYHGYSYAWNSGSIHCDIGLVLSNMNAKLECRIANNNIFAQTHIQEEEEDPEEFDDLADTDDHRSYDSSVRTVVQTDTTPSFITRVRLLVVRKFTIERVDTSDGKQTYKYTVH